MDGIMCSGLVVVKGIVFFVMFMQFMISVVLLVLCFLIEKFLWLISVVSFSFSGGMQMFIVVIVIMVYMFCVM